MAPPRSDEPDETHAHDAVSAAAPSGRHRHHRNRARQEQEESTRSSVRNRQKRTTFPLQQHQNQKRHQHQNQNQNQNQTSAYDDDGTPTESLVSDLRRSLALIHEERHLVAYDLYRDVLGRVEQTERSTTASSTRMPITPPRPRGMPFHSPLRRRQQQQQQQQHQREVHVHVPVGATRTPVEGKERVNRIEDHRDAKALLEQKEDEFTALEVSAF